MRPALARKRIVIALTLGLALVYCADAAWFYLRARHPGTTQPVETFTMPRVLAIDKKGGRIEYQLDVLEQEQTFSCAHSIFRHAGFTPCWYAVHKASQPVPMMFILYSEMSFSRA